LSGSREAHPRAAHLRDGDAPAAGFENNGRRVRVCERAQLLRVLIGGAVFVAAAALASAWFVFFACSENAARSICEVKCTSALPHFATHPRHTPQVIVITVAIVIIIVIITSIVIFIIIVIIIVVVSSGSKRQAGGEEEEAAP